MNKVTAKLSVERHVCFIMIIREREHFTLSSTLEAGVLLCLQEAVIMNPNCVRKPEQIKLIMECRQSGVCDYQWCQKQGIHPATFYNWVGKLRKAGYTISDSESKFFALPLSDMPGRKPNRRGI